MSGFYNLQGGGGGGTPAGANTEIQYNDAGAFGASSALTFNAVNNRLTIGSQATPGSIFAPTPSVGNGIALSFVASAGVAGSTNGGNLNFTAGAAGGGSGGQGGDITFTAGAGSTASGGTIGAGQVNFVTNNGTLDIGINSNGEMRWVSQQPSVNIIAQSTSADDGAATSLLAFNEIGRFVNLGVVSSTSTGNAVFTDGPTGPIYYNAFNDEYPFVIGNQSSLSNVFFDQSANTVVKPSVNAAADTDGFLYIPLVAGAAAGGTPANLAGAYAFGAPCRFVNNGGMYSFRAYINGGWRSVALL